MDLYLKITSGPRSNDLFKLQSSVTLGRSRADINLKDTKASSIHAKIIEEDGALFYLDMNSTNGSFVDGNAIKKIKLVPGVVITIGSTNFEILSEFDVKKTSSSNLSEWRESIFEYLKKFEAPQVPVSIYPFKKCLYVHIKSGAHEGREWILGYGPRSIGPQSTDLCILDQELDGLCLSIVQKDNNIVIESIGDNVFTINGAKKTKEVLHGNVDLTIGNTILEIGYLDEAV